MAARGCNSTMRSALGVTKRCWTGRRVGGGTALRDALTMGRRRYSSTLRDLHGEEGQMRQLSVMAIGDGGEGGVAYRGDSGEVRQSAAACVARWFQPACGD
jgi:hypothetical protein